MQYVVGVDAAVTPEQAGALLRAAGGRPRRPVVALDAHRVEVSAARRAAFLATLRQDARVRFIERDRVISLPIGEDPRTAGESGDAEARSARTAERTVGRKVRRSPATPACARVAVVDTGVALDHPSLRGRIAFNRAETPGNGRDDDGNGYIDDYGGYNAAAGRGDANDENGHGTHVAGIIAAANSATHHSVGMCRDVEVVPVRFMAADGRGSTSGSSEGIVYAVRAGAKVINCSYTSQTHTRVEAEAIAYARARGVLVVAAAGNASTDNDRVPVYPAAHPFDNVVAVASTDYSNIRLAPFSNWGRRTVELAAAGTSIESTWLGGSYRLMSGTSMAAPAVTSAASAVKARRGWNYRKIRSRIANTVTRSPSLRGRTTLSGRLNFERAVGTS